MTGKKDLAEGTILRDERLDARIFRIIGSVAEQMNQEVYVIGGYVRDLFLGRPTNDIDIMTVGDGIVLAEKVSEALGRKKQVTVYRNFGTAMLRYGDVEIEFVGARKESYNFNSRKPEVEPGTLEDDQKRRDFTINALAVSIRENSFGRFYDPFNGLRDLHAKVIRTPLDPDITFSDDPLRMIRAIRFAAQLGFTISEETLEAIARNRERIRIVSAERVVDEMNRIILSSIPSSGFKLLDNTGLLEIIFPEMSMLKGVEVARGTSHKDNFYHTLQVLDQLSEKTDNLWLRWSALLHDIAKPHTKKYVEGQGWTFYSHNIAGAKMVPGIFRKLKLPQNEKMKYVQKMVNLHMRPISLAEEVVTDSAVRRLLFEAGDDIDDLMMLCEADITSKNESRARRYLENFRLVREKLKIIDEKDSIRNFQPPVDGEEIMETFGLSPGREVGIIKNAIKEAILDGMIGNNHEEALRLMFEKAAELGLHPRPKSSDRTSG